MRLQLHLLGIECEVLKTTSASRPGQVVVGATVHLHSMSAVNALPTTALAIIYTDNTCSRITVVTLTVKNAR